MEPSVKSLTEMIGDLIVARIPVLDEENKIVVRLHKVEQSGIWVESHAFNESMLEEYDMPVSVTSLLLFIPFSGIDYILSSIQTIALSETAFGLDN
jgi:hypothetical protein